MRISERRENLNTKHVTWNTDNIIEIENAAIQKNIEQGCLNIVCSNLGRFFKIYNREFILILSPCNRKRATERERETELNTIILKIMRIENIEEANSHSTSKEKFMIRLQQNNFSSSMKWTEYLANISYSFSAGLLDYTSLELVPLSSACT